MRTTTQPKQQSMAVNLAQFCIARLDAGEPETKSGYHFDKSEYSYQMASQLAGTKNQHHLAKNDYRLPDGTVCTLEEAANELELSETRTSHLFSRYKSLWCVIYKNHGKNRKGVDYKDINGKPAELSDIAAQYNCSISTVNRHFDKNNCDHKKAHQSLKEAQEIRESKLKKVCS